MFDGKWRRAVDRQTAPMALTLKRLGLTADILTLVGLVMAVAAAYVIATGHFLIAVAMLIACGVPDLLDGPLAKAQGTASNRGAFFDSVADGVTDALLFGGIAWYLAGQADPRLAVLPLAVLGVSFLVSYERAKAESLGYVAKGGLMERAERIVLLGVAFLASFLLVPILWTMLVLVGATAVQRFVRVWRQASGAPQRSARRLVVTRAGERRGSSERADGAAPLSGRLPIHAGAWRQGLVESRWREWREQRLRRSADRRRGRVTHERRPDRARASGRDGTSRRADGGSRAPVPARERRASERDA